MLHPARALQPIRLEPGELVGTIAGLERAARAAGFETQVWTGFGVRIPRLPAQPYRWQAWTTLYGSDGSWGFQARNDDEGWHVTLKRPGWPVDPHASVVALRGIFARRIPAVMR